MSLSLFTLFTLSLAPQYKLKMGISGIPSSTNLSVIPFMGLSSPAPDVILPSESIPGLAPYVAPLTQVPSPCPPPPCASNRSEQRSTLRFLG